MLTSEFCLVVGSSESQAKVVVAHSVYDQREYKAAEAKFVVEQEL